MAAARRLPLLLPLLCLLATGVAAAAPASVDEQQPQPLSAPAPKALRTLSGLPTATLPTPSPPSPPPPSPPPATGSWLPACSTVNVGNGYDLIATAAAAPVSAAAVAAAAASASAPPSGSSDSAAAAAAAKEAALDKMTGPEFLASIGLSPSFSPPPRGLPITNPNEFPKGNGSSSSNDTLAGASVCSNDVAYTAGPTASATVCEFINCYDVNGQRQCYVCSGTFVGDPSGAGRLIFLTASHCTAENLNTPLNLASSYVTCNRASGATDGIFRATGAAISVINFNQGYGITDGAFVLVAPQSNTNLAYAQRLAIAAIKSNYFSTSVPNYSAGFPQVDSRLEGCTSANLGNTAALHFSRRTAARTLVSTGIQIGGISGCGGNSGGPLVDESACVVYGVLSSTTVACSGGTNFNSWSRLSTTGGGVGVNVPGLSAALTAGAVNFVS